jgi:hypothetical protein
MEYFDDMDMPNNGTMPPMMMMQMTFYWSNQVTILFEGCVIHESDFNIIFQTGQQHRTLGTSFLV